MTLGRLFTNHTVLHRGGKIIATIAVYLLLVLLIHLTFPFVSAVRFNVEFEQADYMQIYYSNGFRSPEFQENDSKRSKEIPAGKRQDVMISLPNIALNSVRIDPGNQPGAVKLYSFEAYSPVYGMVTLSPEQLFPILKPTRKGIEVKLKKDHLRIDSISADPSLVAVGSIFPHHRLVQFILPLLFVILFYLTLADRWKNIVQELLLLKDGNPSFGSNIDALDGLRGVAALTVVADHCYGRFKGFGTSGVWVFIALSGFLLARPFVVDPARILSLKKMKRFFLRRCHRIIPIYYFYITITFLLSSNFDQAIRHYLFLEGAGHLWIIPQEMTFYFLIPVLLLVNYILFRGHSLICFFIAVALAGTCNIYLTLDVFSLYGLFNQKVTLYIGIFLSGVSAAYFLQLITSAPVEWKPKIIRYSSHVGLCILLFFFFFSSLSLYGGDTVYCQIYFGTFGALAALLVLCVVLADGALLQKVLSGRLIRSLGTVSLSFYLFHPLVMGVIQKGVKYLTGSNFNGATLLAVTILFSYLLANLLYRSVEKQFGTTH